MGLEDIDGLRRNTYYFEAVGRISTGEGQQVKEVVERGLASLTMESQLPKPADGSTRDLRDNLNRMVLSYQLALRDYAPHLTGEQ